MNRKSLGRAREREVVYKHSTDGMMESVQGEGVLCNPLWTKDSSVPREVSKCGLTFFNVKLERDCFLFGSTFGVVWVLSCVAIFHFLGVFV